MPNAPEILIVDGNTKVINDANIALGIMATGEAYAAVVEALAPGARCTIVRPADDGAACLPADKGFTDFDGIAWSGSALNAYDTRREVTEQTDFAARAFDSGVPGFGSCFGLQIMTVALGGKVHLNPKGREVPFGRAITLNADGQGHALFEGRPKVFDTVAIHMDEVCELPAGATLLASNAMSEVQAAQIVRGANVFWGVQYHPEYALEEMAAILRRNKQALVAEKHYASDAELDAMATDLDDLHKAPEAPAGQRLELDSLVLDFDQRTLEIANWLKTLVLAD